MSNFPPIHITVNSRLSQLLKKQLTEFYNGVGETPQVMTLSQWWENWQDSAFLRGTLSEPIFSQRVVSGFESQQIWERLLNTALDYSLLNTGSTAKKLYQAWQLLQEYSDLTQLLDGFLTEEVALFVALQADYQAELSSLDLTDPSLLQQARLQKLQQGQDGEYPLPSQFICHGFDEISPFMQQWKSLVEARGTAVLQAPAELPSSSSQWRFVASSVKQEAQQIARWVVEQLQLCQKIKPLSEIRIGIVAPNLADVQFEIRWAIEESLCQQGWQGLSQPQGWLNVSLGESLSQVPLVQNALLTLDIFAKPQKPVRYEDWSNWLLSPYTQANFNQRHELDVALRKLQWANFKWPDLLTTKVLAAKKYQNFKQALKSQSETALKDKLSLPEFVEASLTLLDGFHWAKSQAKGSLSSSEFQQKKTFLTHLSLFGQSHLSPLTQGFHQWLGVFKTYLADQVHQPQSGAIQPIQLLGMLEAGGQTFDALWVMGLNDEAWPRAASPNVFLPIELQRDTKMPRSDAQRELAYAETLMARFTYSAQQIVWSYAQQEGDKTFMPSPLLDDSLPLLSKQPYQTLAQQSNAMGSGLQWQEDAQAPEVPLGEKAPGGTGILAAQNACPLMAFMDFRLGTKSGIEPVEDGLQSTSLGNIVHKVLEAFWKKVKTQTALIAMPEDVLQTTLSDLIEAEMLPLKKRFGDQYIDLESQRILELILDWMALEGQRTSFSVIANEHEVHIDIGGIQFKIKIDRVDLVDTELVILDYKTGRASINDLLSEKMSAPQLAIYLYGIENLNKAVAGLGYGILHSDDGCSFNVVLDDAERMQSKRIKGFSNRNFELLREKQGFEYQGWQWADFLHQLKVEVAILAASVQKGEAQMRFDDEKDLTYAGCRLALRLPEVKSQLSKMKPI